MISEDPHHTRRKTLATANKPTARAQAWEKQFIGIDAFLANAKKSSEIIPTVYDLNRDVVADANLTRRAENR